MLLYGVKIMAQIIIPNTDVRKDKIIASFICISVI